MNNVQFVCTAPRDCGCTMWNYGKVNPVCAELNCLDYEKPESPQECTPNANKTVQSLRNACTDDEYAPPMVTNSMLSDAATLLEQQEAALKAYSPFEPHEYKSLKATAEQEQRQRDAAEKTARELMFELVRARNELAALKKARPLTLEELRQMEGEPVWVECKQCIPGSAAWCVTENAGKNFMVMICSTKLFRTFGGMWDDYGITWIAYNRKPAAPEKEGE